jgi:hypothetical protein
MPQPEQLKQNRKIINQPTHIKWKIQEISIHQTNFYQCEERKLPYKNATLKRDTSRYREEIQTKYKYPAKTTANAAKTPRQMSLFIKQD